MIQYLTFDQGDKEMLLDAVAMWTNRFLDINHRNISECETLLTGSARRMTRQFCPAICEHFTRIINPKKFNVFRVPPLQYHDWILAAIDFHVSNIDQMIVDRLTQEERKLIGDDSNLLEHVRATIWECSSGINRRPEIGWFNGRFCAVVEDYNNELNVDDDILDRKTYYQMIWEIIEGPFKEIASSLLRTKF